MLTGRYLPKGSDRARGGRHSLLTLTDALAPGNPYRRLTVLFLCLVVAALLGLGVAIAGPLLFTVGLVILAVGFALLTDPAYLLWAVFAVIVLLPFATLPVDIVITPTFLELSIAGACAVALAALGHRGRSALVVSPVGWALLVFMGLAVSSFVAGATHAMPTMTSARRFADMLISLALFYLVVNSLWEAGEVHRAYRMFVFLGTGAAAIGVVLYVLPASVSEFLLVSLSRIGYPSGGVLRYIEDDPAQALRAVGTSVDPNVFGGLLAFMGGLLAPQLFVRRRPAAMLGYWAAMGVVGLALLLTFSRGSMFGLCVALGALGLFRHRQLLWMLLAAGLLVLLLPPTREYVQHFAEGVQGSDLATQMRFGEYKDAFLLIGRYPWFGVGFTGTSDVDIYLGVSCVYLLIAEEMGLIGLSAFLITLGTFFLYCLPAARLAGESEPDLEAIILGAATGVLAAITAGVLDHYLFNLSFPHAAALLWCIAGLGVAASRLARERFACGAPAV